MNSTFGEPVDIHSRAWLIRRGCVVDCPNDVSCPNCAENEICRLLSQSCQECPRSVCVASSKKNSTATTQPAKPDNDNGSGVNVGAIVGAVIGGVALVAFLAIAAWWLRRRKRIAAQEEEAYYRQAAADQEKYNGQFPQPPGEAYLNPPPTANSRFTTYSQGSNMIPITYVSNSTNPNSTNASHLSPSDCTSSVRPYSVASSLARSSIASSFMVGNAATQAQAVRPAMVNVGQTAAPASSAVTTKPNTPDRDTFEPSHENENEGEKPISKTQAIMSGSIVARAMTAKPIEILKGKMGGNNNNANKNTSALSDSSDQSGTTDGTTPTTTSTDPSSRESTQIMASSSSVPGKACPPTPIEESEELNFDLVPPLNPDQRPASRDSESLGGHPLQHSTSALSIDNLPKQPSGAMANQTGGDSAVNPNPFATPGTPGSGSETPFGDRYATHSNE